MISKLQSFLVMLFFAPFLCLGQADSLYAEFAADATAGCAPISIRYFDLSADSVISWNWSFEGGNPASSTLPDPVIDYDSAGVFLTFLEVSDGFTTAIDSVFINISEPAPETNFTFEFNNLTVDFQNLTTGSDNYSWDFGDGDFSIEENPSHTFQQEGIYIVKLKASNSCSSVTYTDVVVIECCHEIPNYTANDFILPYDGQFRPGSNLGYFPPWTDRELADIAAGNDQLNLPGVGVKSIRPGLPEHFLEEYGYDARFDIYNHFTTLGLEDNTVVVGFPSEEHRDTTNFCPDEQSEMFANMYADIWDNGENGTPVNDSNYYALYLYKLVNLYKGNVKFWEIWNEPGFDYTFVTAYLPPGVEGNWWENNPDPCDYKLRAPIFNYVRLLRISYEVIKYVDPDAYVTLASVAYPAFLDAILRNTDNPNEGIATTDYPFSAGAYFDVIAIHSYPHFDGTLSEWNQEILDFDYFRHTDQAITSIPVTQDTFQHVLSQYGYDGETFPEKKWIITETNVPRKSFQNYIGSEEAQINFIMKVYIESVRRNFLQMHVYDMAESHDIDEAVNEFQVMGLFQVLFGIFPYTYETNNMAYAYKTMSDELFDGTYDAEKTAELGLTNDMDGAAFLNKDGNYAYVLWAKTTEDMSEVASASYSFPASMGISSIEKQEWDFSLTETLDTIASTSITLTGTPIILVDKNLTIDVLPAADFSFSEETGCVPATIQFNNESSTNVDSLVWIFEGGNPAFSNDPNPSVIYATPGLYDVSLTVFNSVGEDVKQVSNLIDINQEVPVAGFTLEIFDREVSFANTSTNATHFSWNLGDLNVFTENNPTHTYPTPGVFNIVLTAYNACDSSTASQTIVISPDDFPPIPDFSSDIQNSLCYPATVQYQDESSENANSWFWVFDGGTPNTSTEQNPLVTYDTPGSFFVTLMASNGAGGAQAYEADWITVDTFPVPIADFELTVDSMRISLVNSSLNSTSYEWNFGDGNFSSLENPTHTYATGGTYTVSLTSTNLCGTNTHDFEITIESLPIANIGISSSILCGPSYEVEYFDNSSANPTSWSWEFPGGFPSNSVDQNPIVSYPNPGVYNASLIVWNDIGSDTIFVENIVETIEDPIANFGFEINDLNVVFSDSSLNSNTYNWEFGDGNSSDEINPSHNYQNEGTYTVTLNVSNACATIGYSETFTLLLPPVANFNFDPIEGCDPSTIQFSDLTSSNPISWQWSFPGGIPETSDLQNPEVTYASGTYSVELIATNSTGSDTLLLNDAITIGDVPTAAFDFTGTEATFDFTNNSVDAITYEWDFGDSNTSQLENPNHAYDSSGMYTVRLIAANDCGSDTIQQEVDVFITSNNEIATLEEFLVYPNPTNGKFILQIKGQSIREINLDIYNILGQSILKEILPFQSGQLQKSIDLGNRGSGTYLIHLQIDGQNLFKKIILHTE